MVVELEKDMVTAKEEPRVLIPGEGHSQGTSFAGHGFFEASSIRKIGGKYYFVYSSHKSHELCYATSDQPDRDFTYGGTLVSNGDIGLEGRDTPVFPLGNNHGGLVQVGDDVYVFYHRQTNGTEFSRQGCAEKVQIKEDDSIAQVPVTSCGLNGGALAASGVYPASICCHLTDPTVVNKIDYNNPVMKTQVQVTQKQNQSFVTHIKDQTLVGYKYFCFDGANEIGLELRGSFCGTVKVSLDEAGEKCIGKASIALQGDAWKILTVAVEPPKGEFPLYFGFTGEGELDFKSFGFVER